MHKAGKPLFLFILVRKTASLNTGGIVTVQMPRTEIDSGLICGVRWVNQERALYEENKYSKQTFRKVCRSVVNEALKRDFSKCDDLFKQNG